MYHVYNHGNAEDLVFREDTNYNFFLKKYQKYILPIAKTYAYGLMPNHFHLMVKIRKEAELQKFYKNKYPQSSQNFADLISNQFKNFLISYAKSFNKMYNRRGSLFLDNLNRKSITDDTYYTRLIRYIHLNPVSHGFVEAVDDWPYSSYRNHLSNEETSLQRKEVLRWCGGREGFMKLHQIK